MTGKIEAQKILETEGSEILAIVNDPNLTKSAKIRKLYYDHNVSKSAIAQLVTNGLYQHVRNVLLQPLPKNQK